MKSPLFLRLLLLFTFLLAAEGILRAIDFQTPRVDRDLTAILQPDDPWRAFLEPDERSIFQLEKRAFLDLLPATIGLDELGRRLSAREAVGHGARIAWLGSTSAFGRFTSPADELAAILRDEMKDTAPSIANEGLPRASSFQGLARLKERVLKSRPDVVVWMFGSADGMLAADGLSDEKRVRDGASARRLAPSRLAGFLCSLAGASSPVTPRPRVAAEESAALLREARDACARAGVKLLVVGDPSPAGAPSYAAIAECARAESLPFVDVAALLAGRPDGAILASRVDGRGDADCLSTVAIHVAADAVHDELVRRGWLPAEVGENELEVNSPLRAVACDLDRDGADELVTVVADHERVRIAVIDPHDGSPTSSIPELTLKAPRAALEAFFLPALGDAFTLAWRSKTGRIHTRRIDTNGSVADGDLAFEPPPGAESLRLCPVDTTGDGKPEYLADFGATGEGSLHLLSDTLTPVATLAVEGAPKGCRLGLVGGRIIEAAREQALVAYSNAGNPFVKLLGETRRFADYLNPRLDDASDSIGCVCGRFFLDAANDDGTTHASRVDGVVVLRSCFACLCTAGGGYGPPIFPFGAIATSETLAAPAIAVGKRDDPCVLVASRGESAIEAVVICPEGIRGKVSIPIVE